MTRTITKYTGALLLAMGLTVSAAKADDVAISGDIGAYTQYVWRGVEQTVNSTAVQGDLGVSMGNVSAGVWFSNSYPAAAPQYAGKDVVEFDWTVDYSGSFGDTGLGYSVGGIAYTYLYDSASNFPELYAGLSFDSMLSPSLTAYYTVSDSQSKAYLAGDLWIDLGVSGSVADFDLSGTISYANWKKDAVNRPLGAVDTWKSGLSLATIGVSKDVDVAGVTMTPSLTFTYPLAKKQADGNRYIYGVSVKSEFIAGVNFSY
ncbi:MAG: TorF family putative porin [Mariprofundaceae bacterium]|nr:TorF family putative porin [Mariprofundaceae bacterium]